MILGWQNYDRTDWSLAIGQLLYLSKDMNVSPSNGVDTDLTFAAEGVLIKAVCLALFFPPHGGMSSSFGVDQAVYLAQARLEAVRAATKFAPPVVKQLPRGRAVAVNASNNFGKLTSFNDAQLVLDRCWMHDAQIVDGQGIAGVKLQLTFARVSEGAAP